MKLSEKDSKKIVLDKRKKYTVEDFLRIWKPERAIPSRRKQIRQRKEVIKQRLYLIRRFRKN